MKFDATLLATDLSEIPQLTRQAEGLGFDGMWTSETAHDPFLPLALAAEHTTRLTLGTNVALAFPRSPTLLAHTAWDLAHLSKGRFILGLGTQVKAHIQRRFGVTWEKPVTKMREVILAIRAIWECWQNGTRLNFRGEFFKLTLMSPFFSPGPIDYPNIPVHIAGVNPLMCQLAGELCQGLHVHPFHSQQYLREIIWPNVEQGLTKAGRTANDIQLISSIFVIPTDDPQTGHYISEVRSQIAFYASTPTYRPVFDHHGWDHVAQQLSALATRQRWADMPPLINDDILHTFAVFGGWADLPDKVNSKYNGLLNRVSYYLPRFISNEDDDRWQITISGFKQNKTNPTSEE